MSRRNVGSDLGIETWHQPPSSLRPSSILYFFYINISINIYIYNMSQALPLSVSGTRTASVVRIHAVDTTRRTTESSASKALPTVEVARYSAAHQVSVFRSPMQGALDL